MQQLVKARKNGATKADKTKARLIEVTKRLIQEHGSDRITLRSIAASARMKAGSIYYHFNSKDEIIRTVLESGVGGARKAVLQAIDEAGADSSPLVRLRAALGAHLEYTIQEHFSSRLKAVRRLPKRLRDSADRFRGDQNRGSLLNPINLGVRVFRWFDRRNDQLRGDEQTFVNIVVKARKPK